MASNSAPTPEEAVDALEALASLLEAMTELEHLALNIEGQESAAQMIRSALRSLRPAQAELSKLKRQAERRARHVTGLMDKNDSLRHELRKLEDVLAWVYRTGVSRDEVREVVARTIPQRLSCAEADVELEIARFRSIVRVPLRLRFKLWRAKRRLSPETRALIGQFGKDMEREVLFGRHDPARCRCYGDAYSGLYLCDYCEERLGGRSEGR